MRGSPTSPPRSARWRCPTSSHRTWLTSATTAILFQAEGEVASSDGLRRQPDAGNFRLWEVAGNARSDLYCAFPVNSGSMHWVINAALHWLDLWVRSGTPPPSAPRVEPLERCATLMA